MEEEAPQPNPLKDPYKMTYFIINEGIQLADGDKPYQEIHIANLIEEDEETQTYSYTESNLIYITKLANNGQYCTVQKPLPIYSTVVHLKLPKSEVPKRVFVFYQDALGAIKNQLRAILDVDHDTIRKLQGILSQTTPASI